MSRGRTPIVVLGTAMVVPLLSGSMAPTVVAGAVVGAGPRDAAVARAERSGHITIDALTVGAAVGVPSLVSASGTGPGILARPTTHWVSPNAKFVVKTQFTNDGQPVKATGSVILQQKFGSNWVNVGKPAKLNTKGEATIAAISEDFQLKTSYRVASGNIQSDEFTLELGAGKHTAFKLFKGNPRWQPCVDADTKEPIVYQLNLAKAPANWTTAKADIEAAIADVSKETGIVFKAHTTPTTSAFPTKTSLVFDAGVDMVIAAGDATDSTFLPAKVGKVLAVGGFTTPPAGAFISKGYVVIDNRQTLDGGAPVAGKSTWQMVVRHELAHAMGVTHPSDSKQIMNPTYNNLLTTWGAGDLNALQMVGVRKPDTMVFGQTADACNAVTS